MHLATYGTLMLPEVMQALLKKEFSSEPITLNGFERFILVGECYPGLIKSEQSKVLGRIYFDLDPTSFEIIDRFEDEIYKRVMLPVQTAGRGLVEALAYVIPVNSRALLSEIPWSEDIFIKTHLTNYIEMCGRYRNKIISQITA
jgi:gamma-glutamylcyclotransferase (GGCT)/AIG2-like uncharacterized protein YtfP